nr:peptidoglycan-binding protein [Clostridia bacterium]
MKALRVLLCLILCLVCSCALAFEYPEGTLHRGVEGHKEEVEFLQYQLFYAGYLGDDISAVDGVFGKKTEAAVRQFQKEHGIEATGIVCPNTQTALDAIWEASMEPQGGEDFAEEAYPYCYIEHYANGTETVVLCSKHMDIFAQAAEVNDVVGTEAEQIEGLQSGVTIWLDELSRSYELWKQLQPEYAELIDAHQEAFMDYYRAQLAIWNAHYGSPSHVVLNHAQDALAEQCSVLCIILSGVI